MVKVASDFEKIIHEGRERKQNEALAAKIFSKDRRASAPFKASGTGPSLASRVGVKKRSSLGPRAQTTAAVPAGNINGEWTHDLHRTTLPKPKAAATAAKPNSLASRLHAPGTKPPAQKQQQQQQARQQRRAAQTAQALIKAELDPVFAAQQVNVVKGGGAAGSGGSSKNVWKGQGMTIRGLAGPFVVMAQNFAPGTTAADIESAMTPVGGLVSSCRLLKTQPLVIAEIVFESKEGAENVIETFNNQTADGRVLHVYPKVGGPAASQQRAPPTGPRADSAAAAASNSNAVVDGSLGFDDPMETDVPASRPRQNGRAGGGGGGSGLYSDQLVGNNNSNRGRGRSFQRGGRGGSGR